MTRLSLDSANACFSPPLTSSDHKICAIDVVSKGRAICRTAGLTKYFISRSLWKLWLLRRTERIFNDLNCKNGSFLRQVSSASSKVRRATVTNFISLLYYKIRQPV